MTKPKTEEKAIKKTITVFPKHESFIKKTNLNLSRFVQAKLEEEMKGGK